MNGIVLHFLHVSLMSALIEDSWILILIWHSICDNTIVDSL